MRLSRFVVKSGWLIGLVAVLGSACGSSSDDDKAHEHPGPDSVEQDGGHSMQTADAGADHPNDPEPIPMLHGIPIGDCEDPTPQSLAMQGCPAAQPQPMDACSADQSGKTCRYEVGVHSTLTSRVVFTCDASAGDWGPGVAEVCGETCGTSDEHAIEFDVGECAKRTAAVCDDGKGTQYAFDPDGYTLTGAMLDATLEACNVSFVGNLVEMAFVNGCPARMTSHTELDAAAIMCLKQRLATARWKCATKLPCINRHWGFTG